MRRETAGGTVTQRGSHGRDDLYLPSHQPQQGPCRCYGCCHRMVRTRLPLRVRYLPCFTCQTVQWLRNYFKCASEHIPERFKCMPAQLMRELNDAATVMTNEFHTNECSNAPAESTSLQCQMISTHRSGTRCHQERRGRKPQGVTADHLRPHHRHTRASREKRMMKRAQANSCKLT